eukprot:CAMPEP_0113730068 /NCGR_PEP_ID=MMETSP0038_2-20120614/42950_1 /TAXON_ID=2898 /ORGANISM="Cryptomonas paramecium" /LENGTH=136 /DNA_ID=CAMNT_0000662081 /DNA_START=56 /DNA_END=466 /DNA_ORIENTATION=- /assembly_acc=CAM_ASM_000170
MDFPNARIAMKSPLAKSLFRIDGVAGVFFGPDFVTVTKAGDDVAWSEVKPQVYSVIMGFYTSKAPIVSEDTELPQDTLIHDDDSEAVAMIKEILDSRIRPSVQDDGGDITYVSFDEESGDDTCCTLMNAQSRFTQL